MNINKNKFQFTAPGLLMAILSALLVLTSCKKFVEIDPPKTEIIRDVVFTDDATANAAMLAVYIHVNLDHFANGWYLSDVAYICGKSADEMGNGFDSGEGLEFVENDITPVNSRVLGIWRGAYESIYRVNAVLEGLEASSGVSTAVKQQLEGEAKFMRAFNYFYLVNLFGDVPLLTTTDYRVNAVASRSAADDVYKQIIKDLTDAQTLLPADYARWGNEKIRPVQSAATALLARVYLYLENWPKAETEATTLINSPLYTIISLNNVFLKNSNEAIWQFYPSQPTYNSMHGIVATGFFYLAPLTQYLVSAFETGDNRLTSWKGNNFGFDFVFKYKASYSTVPSEYTTNLRLAEQYLIRAEARAQQNNISGAQDDIDKIRNRAGLANTTANTKENLLAAVEQERRVELFAEYGHRWFDLKRWKKATTVLAPIKPKWQPGDMLFPIPQGEIEKNNKLVQNAGY